MKFVSFSILCNKCELEHYTTLPRISFHPIEVLRLLELVMAAQTTAESRYVR